MPALSLIFFASGAAALLFETLWFRQAGLMVGNTVWASSMVVSSFMAGLALGNGLAARHGGSLRRPFRGYALLEVTIAATGCGLVLLFPLLPPLLAPAFRPLLDRPAALNLVRLASAFVLMAVPATAMGATLPILVRALTLRDDSFGGVLGRLYGWNTLGAVAGAMGGELLLIRHLGLRGTGVAAALLDLAAAVGAMALSRRGDESARGSAGERASPEASRNDSGTWRTPRTGRALLFAAFLCGGILLALEVVWFRFLVLFMFGSSLTFATMLSTVLLGIGTGGLVAGGLLRRRPEAHRFAPLLALAAGALTAHTYIAFADFIGAREVPYLFDQPSTILACVRLILPVSFLSGLLFTSIGAALERTVAGSARAAGSLTLANTIGGMLGALLGGFVLIPRLGIERSLFALAAAYGLVALALAGARGWRAYPRREAVATLVAGAAFLALVALFPFGLMRNNFVRQVARMWPGQGSRIVAVREGLTETIVYLRTELAGEL